MGVRARAVPGGRTRTDRRWVLAAVSGGVVFTLFIGLYQLLGWHELHAVVEYDDGVWFGSAVRMADGKLPYRSFVLVQPPGVPVLMVPFGLLSRVVGTREAFGAARLATPVVGAATVLAAGWLVHHRGALAVAVTGGVVAINPEVLIDERTVMLEPYCALLCVLGLVAAFEGDRLSDRPSRLALAGVAFGLAGSCKAFALLPFAVLVVALLIGARGRGLPALLGGAAAAVAVVCGPFFALAPRQFAHQVIVTQLVRSTTAELSIWDRIFSLVGVLPGTGRPHGYPDDSHLADVAIVAAFFALVLGGWAVRAVTDGGGGGRVFPGRVFPGRAFPGRAFLGRAGAGGAGPSVPGLDLVAAAVVIVTALALIQPPAYYSHYAAFFAPFLAVSLGLAAGELGAVRPRLIAVTAAVALVAGGFSAVHAVRAQRADPYEAARLDAAIPPGSCVVTDNPPVLLLANRFTSTVPGCPAMVDAFGTTLGAGHATAGGRSAAGRSAAERDGDFAVWRSLLSHAGYVVLTDGYQPGRIPWTPQLRAYVDRHFRTLLTSPVVLVRRSLSPSGPPGPYRRPSTPPVASPAPAVAGLLGAAGRSS